MAIEDILLGAVEKEASDIHLTVGRPVTYRMVGSLVSVGSRPLVPQDTEALAKEITTEVQRKKIEEVGGIDFGFSFKEKARFRVSCFKQQGHYSMVLRLLPSRFYTFQDIGLPPQIIETLNLPRGLVLVTGPTGSGKTTTLATMLNYINETFPKHLITAEDPIEFVHPHKKGIVTQREVGEDVPSFSEAIVKSLRQDPDVILIGEMRDLPTMESAIRAAETGHLVFSTLHTTGAARTVDRIIDVFPSHQQPLVRVQLAATIVAVISQVLVPRLDGKGRVAAFEIMFATPAIRNLIREGKTYQILSELQTGSRFGMIMLDDYLKQLYSQGVIGYDAALEFAVDAHELSVQLSKIQAPARGRR
ncbi:MAG TPA: type IV pilus twitching motility protein PilT [Candidatus Omnitrophota bacterium]|nr:type IV pilus twitching motility protein PilT [Candidatus Omnitrophota bacterium]